jgi:5'-nucleotidase
VTNDDGIGAAGIDSVVESLGTLEDVELVVIAPRTDWSGSGDSQCADKPAEERRQEDDLDGAEEEAVCTYTDDDELVTSSETTAGGTEGTAVYGTPADSVEWAHENYFVGEMEPPHLTVSGNNAGQNIGQLAYVSGTVGATRESARHGVPGLAVSQGLGASDAGGDSEPDYAAAVPLVLDWVEANREVLLAGELDLDTVTSLNVPTCTEGDLRGLHETSRAEDGPVMDPVDCTSEEDPEGLEDVEAFLQGLATLTPVDVEQPAPTESTAEAE